MLFVFRAPVPAAAALILALVLVASCSREFTSGTSGSTDAAGTQPVTPYNTRLPIGDRGTGSGVPTEDTGVGNETGNARAALDRFDAGDVPVHAGANTSGGSAGDASPGEAAAPSRAPCSGATAGPSMVPIAAAGASYCIDETEVTAGEYGAFLASNPSLTLAPATVCSWKKSFAPGGVFPPSGGDNQPVASVDWCDAAAYCAFAGKHLCGKVGGGPNAYADFGKPADEWYFACSSGGKTTFPYGTVFDPTACVGVDFDGASGFQSSTDVPRDVGTASRCHGAAAPFDALRDLAGNIAEWEDSCDSQGGSADYCHVRGDSYREGNELTMTCAYAPRMTRSYRAAFLGFRCCL